MTIAELVLGGVIAVLVTVVIACIVNIAMNRGVRNNSISFRETFDLLELPIITFYNNGKKFNFLMDSGANYSSINKDILEELFYKPTDLEGKNMGMEGSVTEGNPYVILPLVYNKTQQFEGTFQVVDLSVAFNSIKAEYGVTLHGILGTPFFTKYKYVLDFGEYIAYQKP